MYGIITSLPMPNHTPESLTPRRSQEPGCQVERIIERAVSVSLQGIQIEHNDQYEAIKSYLVAVIYKQYQGMHAEHTTHADFSFEYFLKQVHLAVASDDQTLQNDMRSLLIASGVIEDTISWIQRIVKNITATSNQGSVCIQALMQPDILLDKTCTFIPKPPYELSPKYLSQELHLRATHIPSDYPPLVYWPLTQDEHLYVFFVLGLYSQPSAIEWSVLELLAETETDSYTQITT